MKKFIPMVFATILSLMVSTTASAEAHTQPSDGFDFNYDLLGDGSWSKIDLNGKAEGFSAGYAEGNDFRIEATSDGNVDLAARDDSQSAPAYWASAEQQNSVSAGAWTEGQFGSGLAIVDSLAESDVELTADYDDIIGSGTGTLKVDEKLNEEPEPVEAAEPTDP